MHAMAKMMKIQNEVTGGASDKNGKSGKNAPWVWQIFKLDATSGPLESGNFGKNGDFGENLPKMQRSL